jgi:hypothetical protein
VTLELNAISGVDMGDGRGGSSHKVSPSHHLLRDVLKVGPQFTLRSIP